MAEDAAVEAVVRAILSDLRAKFQLSEAHCNLIAKDIEEIAQEPADRRGQIIQAIEKEIANSVSRGTRSGGTLQSGDSGVAAAARRIGRPGRAPATAAIGRRRR